MSNVTENLRNHLQSISLEQFESEWNEIVNMGIVSPTIKSYIQKANCYEGFLTSPPSNYCFLEEIITFTAPLTEPILFLDYYERRN